MSSIRESYEQIAQNSLKKTFVLKNHRFKRKIELDDITEKLSEEKAKLLACKERVSTKCRDVGIEQWRLHTMYTHPLKNFSRHLLEQYPTLHSNLSQAYFKFAEILVSYPELTTPSSSRYESALSSLHLCEAPGCFVQALADFLPENLRKKWTWRMNSLNPYNEHSDLSKMIYDDRFMASNLHNMVFGPDDTGNIMNFNDDYLSNILGESGKFQLVTYDGGFDCTDNPAEQEASIQPFITHACKVATRCLKRNGCVVFKIYTFFSDAMITFLSQFCAAFTKVVLVKPSCSKPGNSEIYLIGIGYRDSVAEAPDPLNPDVKYTFYEAAKFFAQFQMEMMEFNMATVQKLTKHDRAAIDITKKQIAMELNAKFVYLSAVALKAPFLPELDTENIWYQKAWTYKRKEKNYIRYRDSVAKESVFPITAKPLWPHTMLNNFVVTSQSLRCILLNPAIVASQRALRAHQMETTNKITCSLFADYKLLMFARESGVEYSDLCKKEPHNVAILPYCLTAYGDTLEVDSVFLSKEDWLELCYVAARGTIYPLGLIRQRSIAFNPQSGLRGTIEKIHISSRGEKSLIISRFAGSVIFFLSLFFETVHLDFEGIHFINRTRKSDEFAHFIKYTIENMPSSYDLLQFIPTKMFSHLATYSAVSAYNDKILCHAIDRKKATVQNESNLIMG